MRLSVIAGVAGLLAIAAPAEGADRHVRHYGHAHHQGYGVPPGPGYGAPIVIASEPPLFREPYLPRGVLYNAPPLPVYSGYAEQVVRARY